MWWSGMGASPLSINNSGQVVGRSYVAGDTSFHAFRTAPNAPINPATDDLGTLGGTLASYAASINDLGQVVGTSTTAGNTSFHAFRTAANAPINPATDDLGGTLSSAYGINNSGQVVGLAYINGNSPAHAFRTAPLRRHLKPTNQSRGVSTRRTFG